MTSNNKSLQAIAARVAEQLHRAEAIVVTAGAGMGVDSGLPDFRGTTGFWKAYPPFAKLGLRFEELANPRWFREDPWLAWGFYGHRLNAYRVTVPHAGFAILKRWCERMKLGSYVYTSNVDGAFQKAGFGNRVVELHGSIHRLQCQFECGADVFSADGVEIAVDSETMRAAEPLPTCPQCGRIARPNIFMFNDSHWDERRSLAQWLPMRDWLQSIRGSRLVVLECGAGGAVPTIRLFGEQLARSHSATLVRINPREPETDDGIGVPLGALHALEMIDACWRTDLSA